MSMTGAMWAIVQAGALGVQAAGDAAVGAAPTGAANAVGSRGGEVLDALSQLAGRLHPLTVHFPVGLLLVAALAEVWGAFRKRPAASPLARGCLWFGALSACAAAGMGWLNAAHEFAGDTTLTLGLHRWLGVATAAAAMFAAFMALAAGNANMARAVGAYRAGLVLAALLVAVGGHFGGVLTHGEDYVTEPIGRVVAAVRGIEQKKANQRDSALTGKGGGETNPPQTPPSGRGFKPSPLGLEECGLLEISLGWRGWSMVAWAASWPRWFGALA